jgi:hypothetical protein
MSNNGDFQRLHSLQNVMLSRVPVAHDCNPSYLGGRGQPVRANSSSDPL